MNYTIIRAGASTTRVLVLYKMINVQNDKHEYTKNIVLEYWFSSTRTRMFSTRPSPDHNDISSHNDYCMKYQTSWIFASHEIKYGGQKFDSWIPYWIMEMQDSSWISIIIALTINVIFENHGSIYSWNYEYPCFRTTLWLSTPRTKTMNFGSGAM